MSVEFSNIYQEVLLENLDVIIRQNFIFQAKLKMLEKEADVRAEMQAKINELTVKHQEALQQINNSQHYKVQAENNDAIVQEKTRIQSALNDTMRELGKTKSALELKEKEIEEMSLRISELEKLIPPAPKAVKKVTVKTVEEEKPVKISATETNKIRVEAGGTF